MAESTVVEGPTLDSRPALPLIAGGVVVAGAAVLALLIGPPSILLGGCVLAGFGITLLYGNNLPAFLAALGRLHWIWLLVGLGLASMDWIGGGLRLWVIGWWCE